MEVLEKNDFELFIVVDTTSSMGDFIGADEWLRSLTEALVIHFALRAK